MAVVPMTVNLVACILSVYSLGDDNDKKFLDIDNSTKHM